MIPPVEFHPAVRGEMAAAVRWYERQRAGLGIEFLSAVEQVLDVLRNNPARFGFAEGDIREGLLTRFPYAVYYRVLPDRIRVLAVYHTARAASGWQSRS